jgi:glycosyltransferase involved in cell wall biosynthesis
VDRIKPSLVETIYNGIDIADWDTPSPPGRRSGAPVIATVGNIRRVKGPDVCIKAAASIAAQFPLVSFNIAGDVLESDYFAELQTLIRDLNLSDHFHFVGGVANLREYLSTADIFVLPSRSEGFSNAIVEAMAASLPVVATNVGGNAEAVIDGVSGLIVPPEDPAALSAAITRLLSDPFKAQEMGAAGKKLASEKFTTYAMMHQITLAYASVLRRPSPRSVSDRHPQ